MKKIIPIVVILLIVGLGGYKYYSWKYPDPTIVNPPDVVNVTTSPRTVPTPDGTAVNTSTTPTTVSSANITTEPVINGTYKGVIEVGASGFNAFVVSIDKDKNWELVSKEFGESLAWEGFANADDIKLGVKKYISVLANKGCAGRNIQFIVSSGAAKVKGIDKVIDALRDNYTVTVVTPEQEGKFAAKASIPKQFRTNSFSTDIGSGNTKISWYEGDRLQTIECVGAKYYANGKTDQQVYTEIAQACMKIPTHLRDNCFMIGGVPFSMAKMSGLRKTDRYVNLKAPDEFSAGDDVKLKSGINIYRAIYETTKSHYIFDADANFTIGYLLSMN